MSAIAILLIKNIYNSQQIPWKLTEHPLIVSWHCHKGDAWELRRLNNNQAACHPRYHIRPNWNIVKKTTLKSYEYLKENKKKCLNSWILWEYKILYTTTYSPVTDAVLSIVYEIRPMETGEISLSFL